MQNRPARRKTAGLLYGLLGALTTVVGEAAVLTQTGVTVTVNAADVASQWAVPVWRQAAAQHAPQWEALLRRRMKPLLDQEVSQVVGGLRVNLDGLSLTLPAGLRRQLTAKITPVVETTADTYIARQVRPARLVTPSTVAAIIRQTSLRPLVVRIWGLPVRVRIKLADKGPGPSAGRG